MDMQTALAYTFTMTQTQSIDTARRANAAIKRTLAGLGVQYREVFSRTVGVAGIRSEVRGVEVTDALLDALAALPGAREVKGSAEHRSVSLFF